MTQTPITQIPPEVYQAAQETAVLVDRSTLSLFRVTGATRLDLLERISTQAVKRLPPGSGAATILTTDIGRIIDRLLIYAGADFIYLLGGEGHRGPLARYLWRNVFFQDDFQLVDVSAETAVFALYGPQAPLLLPADSPPINLPLHHWAAQTYHDIPLTWHKTDPIAGDGYFITLPIAAKETLWAALVAAGCTPADEPAFDYLRIEAGQPRFGRELTLDYIPLEANLWADVSFNKGCYTGQEIIARMESRGRLAKRLVRLRAADPLPVGEDIRTATKNVGRITSSGMGPGGAVALGYVKTDVLAEAAGLWVGETAVFVL